jgi:hypothetical protein
MSSIYALQERCEELSDQALQPTLTLVAFWRPFEDVGSLGGRENGSNVNSRLPTSGGVVGPNGHEVMVFPGL